MPPASPSPPPSSNNFDTPEYDALQQQKAQPAGAQQAERMARDCLEEIFHQFNVSIHEHKAHTRTLVDAVDSCLATCLEVIEMQYPAREDHPVSVISLEHGSWEQEKPPDPCTFDSWLRSALPENASSVATTSQPSENWVMQQFLNKQPSIHRSASVRSTGNAAPAAQASELDVQPSERDGGAPGQGRPPRSPAVGYAPGTGDGGGRVTGAAGGASRLGAGASTRSLHPSASRRNVTKLDTRRVLTPEQEHLEEQLRQELQQRKTQEEMSRKLEQRDAEERSKLASLRKELKGKDYTYDHKGEVVILNEFDPERTPLEALSGPGFKVAGPEDAVRAASPKRRPAGRSTSSRSAQAGAATPATDAGAAGLGGLGGGRGTMSPTEMRRERDRRLASDFKKIQPKTQPSALETLMPAGGVTLRGAGGATKSGPLRPAPAGITREAYAKQIAKKAMQAQAEAAGHIPVTPLNMALSGPLPRDGPASNRGSGVVGATAATGGGGGGGSAAAYAHAHAAARSGNSVSAGAAGAGARLDPLAAYGDNRYDPFAGARLRQASGGRGTMDAALLASAPAASAGPVPSSPDINLSLTSAGDWGAAGNGRSYETPSAMQHVKPTEKQLVETVGRVERLPRERAPLPTIAPPLSPLKAGAPKPAERLQFHSILAE